jgi:hypothetical protein
LAGSGWKDASAFGFAEEANGGVVLKLPGLNREIGLGSMQFIRSNAKSSFFEDREQIPKVAKLRPIVECPPYAARNKGGVIDRTENETCGASACGNLATGNGRMPAVLTVGTSIVTPFWLWK